MSVDVILPFLRPIAHLIQDPDVTEIMVNGAERVFVERAGQLSAVDGLRLNPRHLTVAVKNIARVLGDDISEAHPILDARLPDGSRVAAVIPPCSLDGTTLTIRKFQPRVFSAEELVRVGTMTREVLGALQAAIDAHKNILISGGTSTGKTTLLGALTAFLPTEDRVVLIEDTAELHLEMPNLVRLEARRQEADLPAVTIRDLLRAALRHRPDRIIVGEVAGARPSISSKPSTPATEGASRRSTRMRRHTRSTGWRRVLQSGLALPYAAIRQQVATSIDLVLHLERRRGVRRVDELLRIRGYDAARDRYDTETVFGRSQDQNRTSEAGRGV